MTDRGNRRFLAALGFVLLAGGALSAALGGGAFGGRRSHRDVFDGTVIRWWNDGGWESYAVVVAIGVLLAVVGSVLAGRQLRRTDGLSRTPNVTFPAGESPGETTLRLPALRHKLENDLEDIPEVSRATVDLFGDYPTLELHAALTVGDRVDLEALPALVEQALARMTTTTGVEPEPVRVTLRFKAAEVRSRLA